MKTKLLSALAALFVAVALVVPAAAADKDYLQLGFDLMKTEKLGGLGLGSPAGDALSLLGPAEEESPPRVWGADGREHRQWRYPSQGVELGLVAQGGCLAVDRIAVFAPCGWKTARGIGIGSPESEVRAAYRAELDDKVAVKGRLIAGSVYGGLIFTIEGGAVRAMFLGAAAE
jgi:hypothetical protein